MENMEQKFQEYARLLVEVGVNIQKGQNLMIACPVDCAWFARLCAKAAYAAGCREVVMNWRDDALTREKYLNAAEDVFDTTPQWQADMLNGYARERLAAIPDLRFIGAGDAPHILSVSLPGYPSQNIVSDLDAKGIFISAGSACHRGRASHVLTAMGLDKRTAAGTVRVSFGPETTREDVDALAEALAAELFPAAPVPMAAPAPAPVQTSKVPTAPPAAPSLFRRLSAWLKGLWKDGQP